MKFSSAAVYGAAIAFVQVASSQILPQVDLGYAIHQATLNASKDYPYYNFSNIRYARPPVDKLRFSPPLPPLGRNKTVNDGQQGVICPQAGPSWSSEIAPGFILNFLTGRNITNYTNPMMDQMMSMSANAPPHPVPDSRTSEDCLFLDVIAPTQIFNASQKVSKGAPVLVWIYGGGFTGGEKTGSGNPATLISRSLDNGGEGVVYVALNYRLGLFGWLTGSDDVTTNAGLLDQRLALEWVQKNIHKFGGDPSRVTVMGESAGASSIMHQITAYGGKGSVPFQQAIPQSPAFGPIVPSQSKAIFETVIGNASIVAKKSITTADELRSLTFEELNAINGLVVAGSPYGSFTFGPALDPSPNSFAPDFPARLLAQGKFHNVSVMVGHNSNEGLLFTPPFIQTQAQFTDAVEILFPAANASTISTIVDVLYPPVFNGSSPYSNQILRTAQTVGDFAVDCNAYALATYVPSAYAYLFAVPPGLHGEDIGYTFYNGLGGSSLGSPIAGDVAGLFQELLTNFAVFGTPGFDMYGPNSTLTNIAQIEFGKRMKDPAASDICKFWVQAPYYEP